MDLGSLKTREEQALAAEAVLGRLWQLREQREPVLIVIDEAHNVCPARAEDPLTALATEHAVRIAAEGRKFGLYLVVSTQRPQKVHENVISQCDNLVLMRLNSEADAAFARAVFSFVPPGLVGQAATFGLGEALVAGKIHSHPALIRSARALPRKAAPTFRRRGRADALTAKARLDEALTGPRRCRAGTCRQGFPRGTGGSPPGASCRPAWWCARRRSARRCAARPVT